MTQAEKQKKLEKLIEDAIKLNLVTNHETWENILDTAVAEGQITQHESGMIYAALVDFSQSMMEYQLV